MSCESKKMSYVSLKQGGIKLGIKNVKPGIK